MPQPQSPSSPKPDSGQGKESFFKRLWRQQKEMAYPAHVAELNRDVFRTYRGLFSGKVTPKRVERFEDAVARQGLTDAFLAEQLERLKNLQVVMYCLGGFILLYGIWLALRGSYLYGSVTAFWAAGIAIRGYLYAYRAWQIQNRDLIRLQDAIRIKSTYLVL